MLPSSLIRRIHRTFVRQYSRFYCGPACLASVVRYHGGETTQERLRDMCGTTLNGTSLLGLYQAALKLGFDAKGFEAGIDNLKEITEPVVLHILKEGKLEHFVVCYGFDDGKFIIGDPGEGICQYSEEELDAVWISKTLLKLTPGKDFVVRKTIAGNKRHWFLLLVKDDFPVLGVAAFLGVLISVLNLATAVFTQKLIDQILPQKKDRLLITGLIIFGIVLAARAIVGYVRSILLIRQGRDMNLRLVSGFFGKLLFLPKSFFDPTPTGDMVARLNDAQRIQRVVVFLSSQITIDLLVLLVSGGCIFFYSSSAGAFSLLSVPLFILVAWRYNRRIIVAQRGVMQSYAATESKYIDTITGIETIKSFRLEGLFSRLVHSVYSFFMQKVVDAGLIGSRLNLWISLVSALFLTGMISFTAWLVISGQLLMGQMIAIITLAGSLGASVINIALANIQLQEARIAFDRMVEFAFSEPEYIPGNEPIRDGDQEVGFDELKVQALSFRFPGKGLLLNKLSFAVRKGEMVTIFGEVGCGKSTLLHILQRFYPFESGSVELDGQDWNRIPVAEWRGMVRTVTQHVQLFNATILENICLEEKPDAERVVRFCQEIGFHDFIMEFQQGYTTIVSENSVNLSGGQRQLVALARALYHQPRLLLLDEATAAMDRRTEQFVIELLQSLKNKMAVVLVTHRPQLAKYSDRIYIIENKTISSAGPHNLLVDTNRFYREAFLEITVSPR